MKFLYEKSAGNETIILKDDNYKYIFKARRHKADQDLYLRNLSDDFIYRYKILKISKKDAVLKLLGKKKLVVTSSKVLHIGWCIIDHKMIEKVLPMLNELGVKKISFVYCDKSQRNFKINLDKINKISLNSCMQSGRSDVMEFEILNSIKEYFEKYPQSCILDFGGKNLDDVKNFGDNFSVLIGCEGGFSQRERELFLGKSIYAFKVPFVLKSETAVVAVSAKYLG